VQSMVNAAAMKSENTKRRNNCSGKLFRTMNLDSFEDKAAQLKDNRKSSSNYTNPKHIPKKLGCQEIQTGKMIDFKMDEVQTKVESLKTEGDSNTFLVKTCERNKSSLPRIFANQVSSYQEAIEKILLISLRTKTIMVAVEMSYGFTLAEDILVNGQLCINTLSLVNELQAAASEETKPISLNKDDSFDRNTTFGNKNSGKSVLVAAEGTVWTVPSFSLEESTGKILRNLPSPKNTDICRSDGPCRNTENSIIFERGVQVGPVELGLLLSLGLSKVKIFRKPRVSVLSFGEEFINWDSADNKSYNIIDSSGPVLETMVHECGSEIVESVLIHDKSNINEMVWSYLENCDVLLLSGSRTLVNADNLEIFRQIDLTSVRIQSNEHVFFGTFTDWKTRRKTVVFGLPGSLYGAIVAFNLFVKPSLEQMMGSIPSLESFQIELGENVSSNRHGDYHPIYFQEDHRGAIVAKNTTSWKSNKCFSMIGAQAFLHLSPYNKSDIYLDKGAIVDIIPIHMTDSVQQMRMMQRKLMQNMERNLQSTFVTVGIITIGESDRKDLVMIQQMIRGLFSTTVYCTVKNKSSAEMLMMTMKHWTSVSTTKRVIFTVGGVGSKSTVDVRKVTEKVIDRELSQVVNNMSEGYKVGIGERFDYKGTVGICRKTIIINLPENVKALKHCLLKLEVYVETIICALENVNDVNNKR